MNRRDAIRAVMAIPGLTAVSRASVAPTDVIVVEFAGYLTQVCRANIGKQLQQVWPGQKIVILEQGMTLKVVSS